MNTKYAVLIALLAGFAGGLASHYLEPRPAYALVEKDRQALVGPQSSGGAQPSSPQQVRAREFVLVDENGVTRGVFGIEHNGVPVVEIINKGHVFQADWVSAKGLHIIPRGPAHPTLLPQP